MTPIQKTIQSIKRNVEKINEHTWKVYKEQILAHIEDAEFELQPPTPDLAALFDREADMSPVIEHESGAMSKNKFEEVIKKHFLK